MPKPIKKERGVFERPQASGIWWIRYLDQYGREHREKVGMKSAALAMYAQRKTEVRMDKFLPEEVRGKHQRATVAEVIEDYIEAGEARRLKAIDDVKQRLGWFKQQIGELPARSSTANDLETCRRRLSAGQAGVQQAENSQGGWPGGSHGQPIFGHAEGCFLISP